MAQAVSNQTFSSINTPTFSTPVILLTPTHLGRWNRQCSETSAYKIQMPGNYPEESIQHSEHGESLKSRSCVHPVMQHSTCCPIVSWLLCVCVCVCVCPCTESCGKKGIRIFAVCMHSTRRVDKMLTFFKNVFLKWCLQLFICDVSMFPAFEFQVKWDSNMSNTL